MLFISPHAGLKVPLVSATPITVRDDYGNLKEIGRTKRITARFTYGGGIPAWALEKADAVFGEALRRGLPDGVPWNLRVGWLDTQLAQQTENWSDEQREQAEAMLVSHPSHGTTFVLCEKPPVLKPWPKYDNLDSVEAIMERVVEDGYDPEHVAAYERENKNREEVVAALENYVEATRESEVLA